MLIGNFKGCDLEIEVGDITTVRSDMLITTLNSKGDWCGEVDKAIKASAGTQFHQQVGTPFQESPDTGMMLVDWRRPLVDGQTVRVRRRTGHGVFNEVLFVVDDWKRPLEDVVVRGLLAAEEAGAQTVTMPAMRCGMAAGKFEPDVNTAFWAQIDGMRTFMCARIRKNVTRVTLVVYPESDVFENLSTFLRL